MTEDPGRDARQAPAERSNGGAWHLVAVYAHNAVFEVIMRAKEKVRKERGRFTLPSSFMDELIVECGARILEGGAAEAERLTIDRILRFLDERRRLKDEEDERKVRQRMPRA